MDANRQRRFRDRAKHVPSINADKPLLFCSQFTSVQACLTPMFNWASNLLRKQLFWSKLLEQSRTHVKQVSENARIWWSIYIYICNFNRISHIVLKQGFSGHKAERESEDRSKVEIISWFRLTKYSRAGGYHAFLLCAPAFISALHCHPPTIAFFVFFLDSLFPRSITFKLKRHIPNLPSKSNIGRTLRPTSL